MLNHTDHLNQALVLAKTQQGQTAPNPSVGAVVVNPQGKVIGEGYHHGPGTSHAEVEALKNLTNSDLTEATLYITLEPCCHHGRTPPCTDLIISSGIKKVIYAFKDPNPEVANNSEAILKQAGIDAKFLPTTDITEFYRPYAHWWRTGKPYVYLKIAVSADGCIAGKNKQPVPITGEQANQLTHRMRKQCDVILTSINTITNDDPSLNARVDGKIYAKPVYVLSRKQQIPEQAKINTTASEVRVLNGSLSAAIKQLGEAGWHSVWVEVGAALFKDFVGQRLANEVWFYQAKKQLGEGYFLTLPDLSAYQKQPAILLGADQLICYQ